MEVQYHTPDFDGAPVANLERFLKYKDELNETPLVQIASPSVGLFCLWEDG